MEKIYLKQLQMEIDIEEKQLNLNMDQQANFINKMIMDPDYYEEGQNSYKITEFTNSLIY